MSRFKSSFCESYLEYTSKVCGALLIKDTLSEKHLGSTEGHMEWHTQKMIKTERCLLWCSDCFKNLASSTQPPIWPFLLNKFHTGMCQLTSSTMNSLWLIPTASRQCYCSASTCKFNFDRGVIKICHVISAWFSPHAKALIILMVKKNLLLLAFCSFLMGTKRYL